jgi:hypothetical protein
MKIKTYDNFLLEDGCACATAGSGDGMGAVVAPQPSSIPGDVAGSTPGSGDLPAYDRGKYFGSRPQPINKKRKKKSRSTKEGRMIGTEQPKETMYITTFSDWLKSDYNS